VSDVATLAILFFAAAVLYSSVGHAGASAYLAAMALVGVPPSTMKPTALAMNILVASLVTVRFARAGLVDWRMLASFAVPSVPLAFIGGAMVLPGSVYKPLAGVVLLVAAARLAATAGAVTVPRPTMSVPLFSAALVGGGIGLLSGLTGTGGGIFLTPILLFAGWADPRRAAGISSGFILANSISGLVGNLASVAALPPALPLWLVVVAAGGLLGSGLGTRRFTTPGLRLALAAVLLIAGLKLVFLG